MAQPQWLFCVRPIRPEMLTDGPTDEEARIFGEHFSYWQRLTQNGVALVVGRTMTTGPETLGIAIFRADDENAAAWIGNSDPAVQEGVFRCEVFAFRVALLSENQFISHFRSD